MFSGFRLVPVFVLLASPVLAGPIQPVNGSFETGDFTGWTLSIPSGFTELADPPALLPAGTAAVTDTFLAPDGSPSAPFDGSAFALIGSRGSARFLPDQGTFDIQLTQSVTLAAGQTLTGSAFFVNGDFLPQETAWVRILGSDGSRLATPWLEHSGDSPGDLNSVPFGAATPWTQWKWRAAEAGTYNIAMGVTTGGDNVLASFAGFDAIRVPDAPVPAWALIAVFSLVLLHASARQVASRSASAGAAERERAVGAERPGF